MAYTWIDNGPVALPPRRLAYWAGAVVALLALVGVGLGFRAAWREAPAPGSGADASLGLPGDGVLTAKPIVELPPPVVALTPDQVAAKADAAAADKAQAIAEQTAAAQAVQAKPSKPPGNIDDILTSASEKPPARSRSAPADEAPPAVPVKSDVPF